MRTRCWTVGFSILFVLAAAAGCGTSATGITVAIQPNPVTAVPAAAGTAMYSASWDVVVSDLTGVGGIVESIDATVGGSAVDLDDAQDQNFGQPTGQSSLGAFDRRTFHQAGLFPISSGGSATLSVTAHFRAQDGTTHQATATARVAVR